MEFSLQKASQLYLICHQINNRNEYTTHRNNVGFDRISNIIRIMAPNHYNRINTPNASIRYYIQRLLPGYHI